MFPSFTMGTEGLINDLEPYMTRFMTIPWKLLMENDVEVYNCVSGHKGNITAMLNVTGCWEVIFFRRRFSLKVCTLFYRVLQYTNSKFLNISMLNHFQIYIWSKNIYFKPVKNNADYFRTRVYKVCFAHAIRILYFLGFTIVIHPAPLTPPHPNPSFILL